MLEVATFLGGMVRRTRVEEWDARDARAVRWWDALHRPVREEDALGQVAEARYDATKSAASREAMVAA